MWFCVLTLLLSLKVCAYLHVACITQSPPSPSCSCSNCISHIYPFILDSSELVRFGCNHPTICTEVGGPRPTMVTASPSLVGDNNISDCHRFCSLVLERSASTQCKFAFPDGNRLSLVVLDDEGRSLAWTCQYACQFFRLTYMYT